MQGTVINAPVKIESSANIAVGRDNQASHSAVNMKNVRLNGTVVNSVKSKTAVNIAAGTRNQAGQSAIVSNNSKINGKLVNSSSGNSIVNLAAGTENKADQGSVRIENSRLRGTVLNSATLQNSGNLAVGQKNSAAQASIVADGVQIRGRVVNRAEVNSSVNAASGYRNEAAQSSIVIDGEQPTGSRAGSLLPDGSSAAHSDPEQELVNLLGESERNSLVAVVQPFAEEHTEQAAVSYVPGQVVFLVDNDKAGLASLDRVARKYHLTVGRKTVLQSLNRIMVVSSTAQDAAAIAEALKKESGVYNSQPNYVFTTMSTSDPLSPMQNLVTMLDLPKLHSKVSGKNVTVAVVDTGVEVEHEDLRSRIVGYQNFIPDSTYRGEIHGTAVAGIIGAGQNEYGIVGIAPEVSLLALRACRQLDASQARGECFSTSLAASLDAAIGAGVDLVNLSLGADVNDNLLGMIIDNGHARGIVFAAPVGNDPKAEKIAFPASHSGVISIAGLDEQGNPLPNQRLARMADAVAPATHLFVTTPGNGYNFSDGTSLASASISGILALTMEKKNGRDSPCLPRYNSRVSWASQVFACIGL